MMLDYLMVFPVDITPSTSAVIVNPCATILNRIIFCDKTFLPVLKLHRPQDNAPAVAKQPKKYMHVRFFFVSVI